VTIVGGAWEITPSPHLSFIFTSAIGDFAYQPDEFEARVARVNEEDWNLEDFVTALRAAGYGEHLLVMAVSYGGIASGPVHSPDVFGFDFSILAEKKA